MPTLARSLALALALLLLSGSCGFAAEAGLDAALDRAGPRRAAWSAALDAADPEERRCLAFLLEHMPDADLAALDPAFVVDNVRLALRARAEAPWGATIPDALFLNDVLPYAHLGETRDSRREELMTKFLPIVRDCATPGEAALKLNATVFPEYGVRYATSRARADQSSAETIESGIASCTGLSILLADACRAVGVPARLAGIPDWVNKDGNHTWVEVWDGSAWRFVGAGEPSAEGFDHAWFVADAALARRDEPEHAIYALSWRRTGLEFPMRFHTAQPPVPAVNVTDRYAKPDARPEEVTRLLVEVRDAAGARVSAAVVVRDLDDATATFDGISRDEGADLNDLLAFPVARGRSWVVEAQLGGSVARARVEAATAEQRVALRVGAAMPEEDRAVAIAALRARFAGAAAPLPESLEQLLDDDPGAARAVVAEAWAAHRRAAFAEDFAASVVRTGNRESPYVLRAVGARPEEGGWPLVIAMHGGGGAPPEVNDSQWKHMQVYYRDRPEVGGYLYLALRAPNDAWNGFYDDAICPLIERLIEQCIVCAEVDPDRVVLIGYSHGGYGAFWIGPKIPHRFAAIHVSAAAPTEGGTVARGLRTTPFTYMVGETDVAYGRRERCERFDAQVRALRGDREDIYPVTLELMEGFGHGGLPDRDRLVELVPHVRDPRPRELSWQMSDAVVRRHFWVSVPEATPGGIVDATCRDNRIDLVTTNVPRLSLHLDERLVDPARPIVVVRGERRCEYVVRPTIAALVDDVAATGDVALAGSIRIDVEIDAIGAEAGD